MEKVMPTLKELAEKLGYELRHCTHPLALDESKAKVVTPFDLSNDNGGASDSMRYYNYFYLYPKA